MADLVCYISGTLLVLVAVCDVFLTILYARSGISLLSTPINKGIWLVFHHAAQLCRRWKDIILSFCGPVLMVVILTTWAALMITGFALIVWPQLGHAVTASQGGTDPGFWNAFYYSGYTFTTLGVGGLKPDTTLFRFLSVLESAIGFTFFTMTITYFLSVYNALRKRNTFALVLHHKTQATSDAGVYLTGLWQRPNKVHIRQELSGMAATLSELLEAHHLYPILHYFRFREIRYALPRILLICMDTASLARSAAKIFSREDPSSAAADQIWISAMDLLTTMSGDFLPKRFKGYLQDEEGRDDEAALFRRRFLTVVARLDECPPLDRAEVAEAAHTYARLRRRWHWHVMAFCHSQVYGRDEIFPYEKDKPSPSFQAPVDTL